MAYRVFLGNGQYFVSSDVGGGKMQWYAFHQEPPGGSDEEGHRKERLLDLFSGWSDMGAWGYVMAGLGGGVVSLCVGLWVRKGGGHCRGAPAGPGSQRGLWHARLLDGTLQRQSSQTSLWGERGRGRERERESLHLCAPSAGLLWA